MTMTYDARNKKEIAHLGDKTKQLAYNWYNYCIKNGIDILITEGMRDLETQKANLARGASQTLRSYHLVGQAFDWVPVKNGKADWGLYSKAPWSNAVAYGKKIGFGWGGDWKTLVDKPHFEYKAIGYGKDTFKTNGNLPDSATVSAVHHETKSYLEDGDKGAEVKELQGLLNDIDTSFKLVEDGDFGNGTEKAVKAFQAKYKLEADGLAGKSTIAKLKAVKAEIVAKAKAKAKAEAEAKAKAEAKKKADEVKIPANTHKVVSGDTLSEIAKKYKTTVAELKKLNGLKDEDVLQIGQLIKCPAVKTALPSNVYGTLTVLATKLNIRDSADLNSPVKDTADKGDKLTVYGVKNGLYVLSGDLYVTSNAEYVKFVKNPSYKK